MPFDFKLLCIYKLITERLSLQKRITMSFANIYLPQLLERKSNSEVLMQFIYSGIALVVTEIFRDWMLHHKIPFKKVWADNLQLTFFQ